jgi:hypothetical protein
MLMKELTPHQEMTLRLKRVNDIVNECIYTKKPMDVSKLTAQNRSDWNWLIKGKMVGNAQFTNLYNLLSKKMMMNNMFVVI